MPTDSQANGPKYSTLAKAEYEALAMLKEARRNAISSMFTGTKLCFGKGKITSAARDVADEGYEVFREAKKVREALGGNPDSWSAFAPTEIKSKADDFLATCADVDGIDDVLTAITSEALHDLVKEIQPVFGIAAGGANVIEAARKVRDEAKMIYNQDHYRTGFRPGDPQAAADSVMQILRRELTKGSIDLTRHSASTGSKIAGLFVDLGTASNLAISVANAVAGLGLALFQLGLEIKDLKAGNRRLETPQTLSADVFNECPILGCYLLTCSDTSTVANFFLSDIGMPGWQERFEEMKRTKMDPLLKVASTAIQDSRLQLEGLACDKGMYHASPGFFAEIISALNALLQGTDKWTDRWTS